jgi:hypothetical protein
MNPETDAAVVSRDRCNVVWRFARVVTLALVLSIRELAMAIAPVLVSMRRSRAENSGVPMNNAPDAP